MKLLQFAEQLSSDSIKHVSTYVFLILVNAYMPSLCLLLNQDILVAFCTETECPIEQIQWQSVHAHA